MQDISLHILDIAQNSLDAGATFVRVSITENAADDMFILEVADNGRGMSSAELKNTTDSFYTTKNKRFGLGIPMLAQSAAEAGGHLKINSKESEGTVITATMQLGNIDLRPLGDIGSTMMTLIAGHPHARFLLEYACGCSSFVFDTDELLKELGSVPINFPPVLVRIKDIINDSIINHHEKD